MENSADTDQAPRSVASDTDLHCLLGSVCLSQYFGKYCYIWAAPCENGSSGICGQRRPRSACASAQSDQGIRCPQTEVLDTKECFNGEQVPWWDLAHAQDAVNHFVHVRRHAWRANVQPSSRTNMRYSEVYNLTCKQRRPRSICRSGWLSLLL